MNPISEEQFRMIAQYINIEDIGGVVGMSELSIESSIKDLKQAGLIFNKLQKECNHIKLKEDENMIWCADCGKIIF